MFNLHEPQDENLSESQEAKNLQSELAALDESDATKKSSSSVVPEANVGKAQEFEEWKSGILSIEEVRNLINACFYLSIHLQSKKFC